MLAEEFLRLNPNRVYRDELGQDRAIYAFLADRHPNVELTRATIRNLAWSVTMLSRRSDA